MHRRTEALLDQLGVTADQFVIMNALAERPAMTQCDLARRTASDPNTVRAMLLLLERRGLVARPPHHTDARARTVVLTAKGRRAHRKLWKRSEPIRALLAEGLEADDGPVLLAMLDRVRRAFELPARPAGGLAPVVSRFAASRDSPATVLRRQRSTECDS